MTPHTPKGSKMPDRPTFENLGQPPKDTMGEVSRASAYKIEITPEMIEAAVLILRGSGLVERASSGDHLVVRDMLRMALRTSRYPK